MAALRSRITDQASRLASDSPDHTGKGGTTGADHSGGGMENGWVENDHLFVGSGAMRVG